MFLENLIVLHTTYQNLHKILSVYLDVHYGFSIQRFCTVDFNPKSYTTSFPVYNNILT